MRISKRIEAEHGLNAESSHACINKSGKCLAICILLKVSSYSVQTALPACPAPACSLNLVFRQCSGEHIVKVSICHYQ